MGELKVNNTKDKLTQREEFERGMSWLYRNKLEEFYFIDAVIKATVNKEYICVEMVSSKDNHTVTVSIGDYVYKREYKNIEDAMVLVNMVSSLKQEVA